MVYSDRVDIPAIGDMFGIGEPGIDAVIDALEKRKLPVTNGHIIAYLAGQASRERSGHIKTCEVCGSLLPHIDPERIKVCLQESKRGGVRSDLIPWQVTTYHMSCLDVPCNGHTRMGVGVEDKRYRYNRAKSIFNEWKRNSGIVRITLSVYDGVIEEWP